MMLSWKVVSRLRRRHRVDARVAVCITLTILFCHHHFSDLYLKTIWLTRTTCEHLLSLCECGTMVVTRKYTIETRRYTLKLFCSRLSSDVYRVW
jgi:hypothetical protein